MNQTYPVGGAKVPSTRRGENTKDREEDEGWDHAKDDGQPADLGCPFRQHIRHA